MNNYRGIGRTSLMIETLPATECVVVVPSRDVGAEIERRAVEMGRADGTLRTVAINAHGDYKKLGGLALPVFFDHSFFEDTERGIAFEAVNTARICSKMHAHFSAPEPRPC